MGYTATMCRRVLLLLVIAIAALPASATGHRPGSDGGPAGKDCGIIRGVSEFGPVGVGATRMRCRVARSVARRSVRGESVEGWGCTGKGTRFGHCHGRGARRGKIAHWFAAH
jgi:hypothetical protein